MNTANDLIRRGDAIDAIGRSIIYNQTNRNYAMSQINAIPASPPPAVESAQGTSADLADAYADDVLDALWKLEGNEGAAYKIALAFHDKLDGTSATPPPSPASVDEAMVRRAAAAWTAAFGNSETLEQHLRTTLTAALSLPAPAQVGEMVSIEHVRQIVLAVQKQRTSWTKLPNLRSAYWHEACERILLSLPTPATGGGA